MEQSNKITIGFRYIDTWGNEYTAESTREVFFSLGDDELDTIGKQFNAFLSQAGYMRRNDHMLMEDLTQEEIWLLLDYLDKIRDRKESAQDENKSEETA